MFILHLTIHLKIIVYFYDSLLILSTCHQHLRKSQQSGIRRLPSKQKGKPDFKEWERDWKKWQRKWDCKEREANSVCKEKPDSTKFRIDPFCFNRLCQVARASICSQCISLWERPRGCFKFAILFYYWKFCLCLSWATQVVGGSSNITQSCEILVLTSCFQLIILLYCYGSRLISCPSLANQLKVCCVMPLFFLMQTWRKAFLSYIPSVKLKCSWPNCPIKY